jgi:hypothetical protein
MLGGEVVPRLERPERTIAIAGVAKGYLLVVAELLGPEAVYLKQLWSATFPDVPLLVIRGEQTADLQRAEVPESVREWLDAALRAKK